MAKLFGIAISESLMNLRFSTSIGLLLSYPEEATRKRNIGKGCKRLQLY